jgi:hypothetical protein
LIGKVLGRGSLTRRIVTRAVVVFGALSVGGLITRSFPHDQVLVFPVGSAFPNATRFSASWKQAGDGEPRGGVTLAFTTPAPLQIRQHAALPNGDYLVSIEVVVSSGVATDTATGAEKNKPTVARGPEGPAPDENTPHESAETARKRLENPQTAQVLPTTRGVQTNIERRVTLSGGETIVALAAGGF